MMTTKIPSLILNADARKIGKEKQNQEEKEAVWWLSCTAGIKNKDPINSPETTEHQGEDLHASVCISTNAAPPLASFQNDSKLPVI